MWESEPALLPHSYKRGFVAAGGDATPQTRNFHFWTTELVDQRIGFDGLIAEMDFVEFVPVKM
jgi:hypothetical protein